MKQESCSVATKRSRGGARCRRAPGHRLSRHALHGDPGGLLALGGRAQWAPNEKVALEVGIGVAFAGARALVTMKHVGLNVAADPLFTAPTPA